MFVTNCSDNYSPTKALFEAVEWQPILTADNQELNPSDATHEGELKILPDNSPRQQSIKVYRLRNDKIIIDQKSFEDFWSIKR